MSRTYSVAEANKTLPYVRAIVAEVAERYAAIQELSDRHGRLPRAEQQARDALREEINAAAARLQECLEELSRIGVELKDYELGLVDFPAELEGRPIHLCWKRDEDEVSFWHEVDAGFKGRRPVPVDSPSWPRTSTSPAKR